MHYTLTEDKKYEESRLLVLLANDSEFAFQLLFERYKDHIYKVARSYVKSPLMAEEILQDVFMKVWKNRKSLAEIQSFEAWLYTISKNTILNYNKRLVAEWKMHKDYSLSTPTAENNADYKLRDAQLGEIVHEIISQLSPQQQMIYKLAKEQRLSYLQIAERLSISPLTVKTHLARALKTIRVHLSKDDLFIVFLICESFFDFF